MLLTIYGTKLPILWWCAVNKLLTHSLNTNRQNTTIQDSIESTLLHGHSGQANAMYIIMVDN